PHNSFRVEPMEKADPASSEDVKRMVQDLGTTIQRTLAESPQIAHSLNRIKAEGYDVSLVLEATIGFSKTGRLVPAEHAIFAFSMTSSAYIHVLIAVQLSVKQAEWPSGGRPPGVYQRLP